MSIFCIILPKAVCLFIPHFTSHHFPPDSLISQSDSDSASVFKCLCLLAFPTWDECAWQPSWWDDQCSKRAANIKPQSHLTHGLFPNVCVYAHDTAQFSTASAVHLFSHQPPVPHPSMTPASNLMLRYTLKGEQDPHYVSAVTQCDTSPWKTVSCLVMLLLHLYMISSHCSKSCAVFPILFWTRENSMHFERLSVAFYKMN